MRKNEYITNLTTNLITKNRYDAHPLSADFVTHVKDDLEFLDVKSMTPETLGRIMGSFEIGDVMASKKELFEGVTFGGDCEQLLRELVALCLALAIRDRLDPHHPSTSLPPYQQRRRSPFKDATRN